MSCDSIRHVPDPFAPLAVTGLIISKLRLAPPTTVTTMAPGTARSGSGSGRTPSNTGRGRGRGRGRAASRGRGRGRGRGGRGRSRSTTWAVNPCTASRDTRTTPDGGKPHGFVSVVLRDYSHEILQENRYQMMTVPTRMTAANHRTPTRHPHIHGFKLTFHDFLSCTHVMTITNFASNQEALNEQSRAESAPPH